MSQFLRIYFIFIFLVVINSQSSRGQSLTLPSEGFYNTFGTAISTGVFIDKDAVFWGVAVDYSRVFKHRWILNISFSYDQEHSKSNEEVSVVNTLTPSIALGYAINRKFAFGMGLGKGLFDDDNEEKRIKFNRNGGYTIGLIFVYSFYQRGPHSLDVSGGIERGLSSPETDLTLELGYGYSF